VTGREFEDLLAAHFDGALDQAGAAQLDEFLASDPRAAGRFAELTAVEGLLRARAAGPGATERLAARVMRSVRNGGSRERFTDKVMAALPERQPGRRRPWSVAAAAAVLAMGLGAWAAMRDSYPEPRASGPYRVSGGGEVRRGSVLSTAEGPAAVALGGYCRIELGPRSTLRLEGAKRAEQVFLEQGEVRCEVNRAVGSFAVRTEVGTVSVTGTQFSVRVIGAEGGGDMYGKRMFVKVLAGAVLLGGTWGSAVLQAGEDKTVPEVTKVKGTVVTACPQGKMLKLKTDAGQEITFGVLSKAAEQVKALKAGNQVEVSCVRCPKTGTLLVAAVSGVVQGGDAGKGENQAPPELTKFKGTVVFACPQGKMLKLKTENGQELVFGVLEGAAEQVKALKAGSQAEVSCARCPKTGNLMVLSVSVVGQNEKPAPDKDLAPPRPTSWVEGKPEPPAPDQPAGIRGTVVLACPQGKMLKLKTDAGQEITFGVLSKAAEQVKALKAGNQVEVSCVRCPKTGTLLVAAVSLIKGNP